MRHLALSAIMIASLGLLGCETAEDNKIAKAQACLDGSNANTAGACGSMVDGIESANAYAIKCASGFISEGFDTVTMARAFAKLSESESSTTAMMGFLIFSSQNVANVVAGHCTKSGVPSMAMLGSLAQTATLISSACSILGSCSGFDPLLDRENGFPEVDFEAALNHWVDNPDPAVNAAIGSAVLVAYEYQCAAEANKNSDICSQVVGAISISQDPAAIGSELLRLLADLVP